MLFGANPSLRPVPQSDFYSALSLNGVRYVMGGHDHMHCRSIMLSPDRTTSLQQLICSSYSYKFYVPLKPGNDTRFDNPIRETPVSQELFTFGYYIFTLYGPQVTVEFYASPNGCTETGAHSYADVNINQFIFHSRSFCMVSSILKLKKTAVTIILSIGLVSVQSFAALIEFAPAADIDVGGTGYVDVMISG
jgi:hypothetical protein